MNTADAAHEQVVTTNSPADDRFKTFERTTASYLNPDQYAIIRVDGRAFHTYCAGLEKPADELFMAHMDAAAVDLAEQLSGVRLVYVQSDEISLLISPWAADGTRQELMFAGNVQKLVSVAAAIASVRLNLLRHGTVTDRTALFDGRAFSLPTREDVVDYFTWRQRDAARNSLAMTVRAHFGHRQVQGLNGSAQRRLLADAGVNPEGTPDGFRRGRTVTFEKRPDSTTFVHKRTGQTETVEFQRTVAVMGPAPLFADDDSLIPQPGLGHPGPRNLVGAGR